MTDRERIERLEKVVAEFIERTAAYNRGLGHNESQYLLKLLKHEKKEKK